MTDDGRHTDDAGVERFSTRRTFLLKAGALLGFGLAAHVAGLPAAFARGPGRGAAREGGVVVLGNRRMTLLETLSLESFSGQLNSHFVFRSPEGAVEMVLVEARPVPGRSQQPGVSTECFSLMFRGPASRPLEQASYPVDHSRLGTFELFIVPVAGDEHHVTYQAIFNRLKGRV